MGSLEKLSLEKSIDRPILTSGEVCREAEKLISQFFDVKGCKLVNSWTNGAVAALLALEIGPGDEVIVPSMTFIATANVVELVGAKPIFCDVSEVDLMITPELISHLISPKTRAVFAVNLYGQMADIKALSEYLKPKNIVLIEDSAHAFESSRDGYRSGKYSDLAIFSFYATKNITCGEGGAIISNSLEFMNKLEKTVHHGMSAAAQNRFTNGRYNHWDMEVLGTKANLPDILAALLVPQINSEVIQEKLKMREAIANLYRSKLSNLPIKFPAWNKHESQNAFHLFPISVESRFRDSLITFLNSNGIGATVNYNPVHKTKYYKDKYPGLMPLTISEHWGASTLTLPLYPSLPLRDVEYIAEVIEDFFKQGLYVT